MHTNLSSNVSYFIRYKTKSVKFPTISLHSASIFIHWIIFFIWICCCTSNRHFSHTFYMEKLRTQLMYDASYRSYKHSCDAIQSIWLRFCSNCHCCLWCFCSIVAVVFDIWWCVWLHLFDIYIYTRPLIFGIEWFFHCYFLSVAPFNISILTFDCIRLKWE